MKKLYINGIIMAISVFISVSLCYNLVTEMQAKDIPEIIITVVVTIVLVSCNWICDAILGEFLDK